mmetsp:Transcript_21423/g.54139  ORF Transcript_21423/g.54139 Transcript_21423/m.54139 type:complete len:218 (-) Transcript_21423:2424-3077(-)
MRSRTLWLCADSAVTCSWSPRSVASSRRARRRSWASCCVAKVRCTSTETRSRVPQPNLSALALASAAAAKLGFSPSAAAAARRGRPRWSWTLLQPTAFAALTLTAIRCCCCCAAPRGEGTAAWLSGSTARQWPMVGTGVPGVSAWRRAKIQGPESRQRTMQARTGAPSGSSSWRSTRYDPSSTEAGAGASELVAGADVGTGRATSRRRQRGGGGPRS